jgi:alpha-glucoside transport system permease protein
MPGAAMTKFPVRGQRVFVTATSPPEFTLENYRFVLFDPANSTEGMAKAFFNTLTVTIPATIIPIVIAAFAAYALAWMDFPGRALLIAAGRRPAGGAAATGADPAAALHNGDRHRQGLSRGLAGAYRLRPAARDLSVAQLHGRAAARHHRERQGRRRDGFPDLHQDHPAAVVPGAGQSFAIFQFLWTWNDLLVAKVFLIDATGETTVMTNQIVELLGTRGGNWEILATSAFVSIAVPLVVFFAMQKYLVRGLLAGSVKVKRLS